MKSKVLAACYEAGTLFLNDSFPREKDGSVLDGGLAHYTFKTPESLVKTAKTYDYVRIDTRTRVKGKNFTLARAQKVFEA